MIIGLPPLNRPPTVVSACSPQYGLSHPTRLGKTRSQPRVSRTALLVALIAGLYSHLPLTAVGEALPMDTVPLCSCVPCVPCVSCVHPGSVHTGISNTSLRWRSRVRRGSYHEGDTQWGHRQGLGAMMLDLRAASRLPQVCNVAHMCTGPAQERTWPPPHEPCCAPDCARPAHHLTECCRHWVGRKTQKPAGPGPAQARLVQRKPSSREHSRRRHLMHPPPGKLRAVCRLYRTRHGINLKFTM